MRLQWIGNCQGFILVYNISNISSFRHIQRQLQDVYVLSSASYTQAPIVSASLSAVPIVLVGNMKDKSVARQVTEDEGRSLANK